MPIGCLVGGRSPARSSTPKDAAEARGGEAGARNCVDCDAQGRRSRSDAEPHVRGRRGAAGVGLPEAVSAPLVPRAPSRLC